MWVGVSEVTGVSQGQLVMLAYAAVLAVKAGFLFWICQDLWTLRHRLGALAAIAAACIMLVGCAFFVGGYFGEEVVSLGTRRVFFLAHTLAILILLGGISKHYIAPAAARVRAERRHQPPEDQ